MRHNPQLLLVLSQKLLIRSVAPAAPFDCSLPKMNHSGLAGELFYSSSCCRCCKAPPPSSVLRLITNSIRMPQSRKLALALARAGKMKNPKTAPEMKSKPLPYSSSSSHLNSNKGGNSGSTNPAGSRTAGFKYISHIYGEVFIYMWRTTSWWRTGGGGACGMQFVIPNGTHLHRKAAAKAKALSTAPLRLPLRFQLPLQLQLQLGPPLPLALRLGAGCKICKWPTQKTAGWRATAAKYVQ